MHPATITAIAALGFMLFGGAILLAVNELTRRDHESSAFGWFLLGAFSGMAAALSFASLLVMATEG